MIFKKPGMASTLPANRRFQLLNGPNGPVLRRLVLFTRTPQRQLHFGKRHRLKLRQPRQPLSVLSLGIHRRYSGKSVIGSLALVHGFLRRVKAW